MGHCILCVRCHHLLSAPEGYTVLVMQRQNLFPKVMQKYSKISTFVLINRIIPRLETAHHMRTSEARVGGDFRVP